MCPSLLVAFQKTEDLILYMRSRVLSALEAGAEHGAAPSKYSNVTSLPQSGPLMVVLFYSENPRLFLYPPKDCVSIKTHSYYTPHHQQKQIYIFKQLNI